MLSRNIDDILAELAAGRPVLVLHNYGLPFLPRWHYAVVVGYDSARGHRHHAIRSETPTRVAHAHVHGRLAQRRPLGDGGVASGRDPCQRRAGLYLEAAADFERGATAQDARLAFDAAVRRWPEEPVGWIGRGTAHYRDGKVADAARDYAAALRVDGSQAGARNNLAQALLDLGCPRTARQQLAALDDAALSSPLKEAVEDTRRGVESALRTSAGADPATCAETMQLVR